MRLTRKNILFFAAAGLLLVSLIYRIMNPYVQSRVDTLTYTGKVDDSKVQIKPGDDRAVTEPFGPIKDNQLAGKVYKNLFSLYKPPQTERKEKQPIPEKKDSESKNIEPVTKDPIIAVKEYIASYRFYGSYERAGKKAIFLAKNKLVLVARTGDRIDGKYLIDDIQDDFIRIKVLDLNKTIDINIREFNDD